MRTTFKFADGYEMASMNVDPVPRVGETVRFETTFPTPIKGAVREVQHFVDGYQSLRETWVRVELDAVLPAEYKQTP